MRMLPRIKVITDIRRPGWCRVFVNDFEIPGLRSIDIKMPWEEVPTVTITMVGLLESEEIKEVENGEEKE
jgi:hypothetical protein